MGTANCLVSESGHSVGHQPGHSRNSIDIETARAVSIVVSLGMD